MGAECLPAWELYPGLTEIARRNLLLYPAAPHLDRMHSEK
eukprot:gene49650-33297_t